ncbi:hypothetical protein VKI21_06435 [Cyanobacterium aponinum UTEX 3222]|uniref:hypothetical protein n=1 Tax=Cyanobacterium aponinum TaxID=379064 RepID=UPI002B4C1102|nr:hypothetical protein [Cyanobacterium aponinum]WRL36985.1 hypothetical protein VKI22_10105 [Cyanobacterium aponinum UTEX 3221]WRL43317.1 hypothetical protein VKI21_06435 [Cyanobacterium aponinum UTEX 3222]
MIKIYLDVCCLNRPFDDWSYERNRLEGESVTSILQLFNSDDRLLKKALEYQDLLKVKLDNPVIWLMNNVLLKGD